MRQCRNGGWIKGSTASLFMVCMGKENLCLRSGTAGTGKGMVITVKELDFNAEDLILHKVLWLIRIGDYKKLDAYIQHNQTSCFWHSVAVAYYSVRMARFLHLKCNYECLAVGALLHDYVFYDWHEKDKSHRFHGLRHPKTAWHNALKIKNLDKLEDDIIRKHMFPLTPYPPVYKESIIVCLVDKACSLYEISNRNAYQGLTRKYAAYLMIA
ncbi:HD domain-containing protein [Anaerocolumna jejuensis]|uniref:HD domain-containing protein n=1 Tax=Anaerocolumna jejuensis TaxID=259063 RepID=UPI003F7BB32B